MQPTNPPILTGNNGERRRRKIKKGNGRIVDSSESKSDLSLVVSPSTDEMLENGIVLR
jgi:hypothetical protein